MVFSEFINSETSSKVILLRINEASNNSPVRNIGYSHHAAMNTFKQITVEFYNPKT